MKEDNLINRAVARCKVLERNSKGIVVNHNGIKLHPSIARIMLGGSESLTDKRTLAERVLAVGSKT